jgi:hypothetical protein
VRQVIWRMPFERDPRMKNQVETQAISSWMLRSDIRARISRHIYLNNTATDDCTRHL